MGAGDGKLRQEAGKVTRGWKGDKRPESEELFQ